MDHLVDLTEAERRPMRLCTYVELPFDTVVDHIGGDLLATSIRAALEDPGDLELDVEDVELVARGQARIRLSWRKVHEGGEHRPATLSLLAVQSGQDALTELLLDVSVGVSTAPDAATAARRMLAELDRRLTRLTPV